MKLYLNRGQFQLAYGKVLYSDGDIYFPFRTAFKQLGNSLEQSHKVLVLGAGIGSVGMILQKQFPDKKWNIDFLDIEDKVLAMCRYTMRFYENVVGRYFQNDAKEFVSVCQEQYDLICVDVFDESHVPEAILSTQFLTAVKQLSKQDGNIVMNTMFFDDAKERDFETRLAKLFEHSSKITKAHNRIYTFQ